MEEFRKIVDEIYAKFRVRLDLVRSSKPQDPLAYISKLLTLEDLLFGYIADYKMWEHCPQDANIENRSLPFYQLLDKEVSLAEESLLSAYLKNELAFDTIKEYLLEYPVKFHLLARMKTREVFELALEKAKEQLTLSDTDSWPEWILLLQAFATNDAYLKEIQFFLQHSFEDLKTAAITNPEMTLLNQTIYNALCRLIGILGLVELAPLLVDAFIFAIKEEDFEDEKLEEIADFYELNLTAGTAAISLSALGYSGKLDFFDEFLKEYEWRYRGDQFVMEVRYAKWILTEDASAALDYLADSANKKGLAYAVCALADLGAKEALGTIQKRFAELDNPVTKEVFKEAIFRLQSETRLSPSERMIWMFGGTSSTEVALGAESTNLFIARARALSESADSATMFEVDDSSKDDI